MKLFLFALVSSFLPFFNAMAIECTNFSGHWVGSCEYNSKPVSTKPYETLLEQPGCNWIGHKGSAQFYPIGSTTTQSYSWNEQLSKYTVANTYEYVWGSEKTRLLINIVNTSQHEKEAVKVWNFKEEMMLDSGKLKRIVSEKIGNEWVWFYKCTAEIKK